MRLICPNCDAQYDIADDVIPDGGRDVQCSSCAHTWFQTDKPRVAGRSPDQTKPSGAPSQPEAPKRQPLQSSIADILREEAGREHDVPAPTADAKAPPAKDEGGADPDETRKRIAQMTEANSGSPAAIAAAATGAVATGANLRTVPGIDEINASLRARAEASDTSGLTEDEKHEVVKRRGFRRGFFFVLLILAILIGPYFFVDEIVSYLPQLEGAMTSYVEVVNQIRVWLDAQVQMIQGMIADFTAQTPAEDAAPEPVGLAD